MWSGTFYSASAVVSWQLLGWDELSIGLPSPATPVPGCRRKVDQAPDGARLSHSESPASLSPSTLGTNVSFPRVSRGKLITRGSSVSPLTWQGKKTKRNRVSCGLVGSPIKGGKRLLCDSKWATFEQATPVPVTSGKSLLLRFCRRWLSPLPAVPTPAQLGPVLLGVR